MNLSKFAERLSELIFEHDLNATTLAERINCGNATIHRYLGGNKMPSVSMLIKLSNYFKCTTDFMLGIEDESYTAIFSECPPFKERLRSLCKHYNISVYRLQKLTNITESTVYDWLRGVRNPSVDSLVCIAEKLDCSVDFVLGRSN